MTKHIIYRLISFTILLTGLLSCTSSIPEKNIVKSGDEEGVLYISVPVNTPTSRAQNTLGEQNATQDEMRITSLWFMAYPTGGDGTTVITKLDTDQLTHDNKTFSIKMKYGTYRIYVAANVPEIYAGIDEESLRAIVLKYKDGDNITLPDTDNHGLPMFYEKQEPFTLTYGKSECIVADLTYTCVKIRYTLVFDNTENGISNPTFGTNVVKIDGISVQNIADRAPLVPDNDISGSITLFDTDASGAFNGMYCPGVYNPDNADNYTFDLETIDNTQAGQWAYRGIFYLPEHFITQETQDSQTKMTVHASLYTAEGVSRASLEYTIELGDTEDTQENLRQLPRGRMYDITGRITGLGDKIETTAAVKDWTLQTISTDLNGPYYLYVEKTSVALEAGKDVTVPCHSDFSSLDYESPQYTLSDGTVTDIYQVEFNKDENGNYESFTVRIHPNMPPVANAENIEAIDKYFYIVAGSIRKKIVVNPLKLEPYLIVTPQNYTIYIKEISNLTSYDVTYTYRTNLPSITIKADKDINYLSTKAGENVFSATSPYSGNVIEGTGQMTCTLEDPYISGNFPISSSATYTFTASEYGHTLTQTADIKIIPNSTVYRLHFRPITDDWENPHIYIYEPLYTPNGTEITIPSNPEGENAIQYGFTGKITFMGWTNQGGTVNNPVPSYMDKTGNKYQVGSDYDPNIINTNIYNIDIDYCPSFRTDCCAGNAVNRKWPGVKMKPDDSNPGWFYFDLPVLAEPGKSLIMFANGHDGPSSTDYSGHYRYPAHMVPGVPLYNFADKDGWFLYDYTQGDKNEFVDDKPNIMDKVNSLPDGVYRIWCKTEHSRIHIWIDEADYTGWNDGLGELRDNGDGYKYFDIKVSDSWRPSGTINYILHTVGGGQTDDLTISTKQWKSTTGKTYDYEVYI
ncbi:hypothetical protein H6A61_05240 [Bacteroides caecigallinarum]|uniref:hypothetical protein n=1 Tax=Bacteroides caecigallinarum TaxID=1411144 RepID=UPI00195D10CF|nr:hypothetical protein [Bacteroides caecigallinarum]MBM6960263.1 hypothetical protein [Bacteroides caecigallinarum]